MDSALTESGEGRDRNPRRRWGPRLPFAVVTLFGGLTVLFGGPLHPAELVGAAACLSAAVALTSMAPMSRSSLAQLAGALSYVAFVALLVQSEGGGNSGSTNLALLAVLWIAMYGPGRHTAAVVAASALAAGWLAAASGVSDAVVARRATIWLLMAAAVAVAVHQLRGRFADALAQRDRAVSETAMLSAVLTEMTAIRDPARVIETATAKAVDLVGRGDRAGCMSSYLTVTGGMVEVVAQTDKSGLRYGRTWPLSAHPQLERAVSTLTPVSGPLDDTTVGHQAQDLVAAANLCWGAWVPIVRDGSLHGVLTLGSRDEAISTHAFKLLVSLGHIVELAISNASEHHHMEQLAHLDPLTGLVNRRGLTAAAAGLGTRITVVAADLDGLKEINDTSGHEAGDGALKAFADALRRAAGPSDIIARVGGDEFVIVSAGTEATAVAAARRILVEIEKYHRAGSPIGASIGIASSVDGDSFDDVSRRADAAMYEAKRTGGMTAVRSAAGSDCSRSCPNPTASPPDQEGRPADADHR